MSLMLIVLALAAPAPSGEFRLECVFAGDPEGGPPVEPQTVNIILGTRTSGKPNSVRFDDPSNILGDDYGEKTAASRRWTVKGTGFDGMNGFVEINSRPPRPGHAARVWFSGDGAGLFKGRFVVNRGMLTEFFAEGESGEVTCRNDPDGAGPGR
ncbi:hypothetical protein [Sphingomonas colocasiae]|uniref:Uncharacterized protein n=1 Tax=Sphingomonas colocasiae TaxID=1848973 RepID=A0ABS7PUN9_9SPHN|nr:hypothetical protein [Sphingomonas colocasiae]MBY8825085.1 hypothetical protein [Sphingomonas colocasiae]